MFQNLRVFALLLCAFAPAACTPEKPRADLIFIQSAEPETIDPALASDQVSMRISSSLFEGLCRVTAEGKPEPGMAERWDISEDKKTYTFHLRAGITWTNGKPVTAHDFADSWRRVLTPGTGADYANLMFIVRGARTFFDGQEKDFTKVGVQALNERTLRVELENPTPYFIDLCSFITLAPVSLGSIRQHGTAWIIVETG